MYELCSYRFYGVSLNLIKSIYDGDVGSGEYAIKPSKDYHVVDLSFSDVS